MAEPRFAHTVQLPPQLEEAWIQYQRAHPDPESFNALVNRLMSQELEGRCDTMTKI